MQSRAKLTWFTLMVLALSAEGLAGAQSAPTRASDPTLARIQQGTASVGPELAAARASLGGTAKKSDTGATVDWDSLANRQAAAGTTVRGNFAVTSGAGGPIQSNAGGGDSLQLLHGDATGATSTAAGPVTRVVPLAGPPAAGASTNLPAPHAEAVVRGQINPAARSCYQNDPDSKSKEPVRLGIIIKLTPAGEVDSVSVSSNIAVSPSLASCITAAAHAAKFAAPGATGATVRTALTFPGQDDDASTTAAHAKGAPVAHAPGHAAHDTVSADTPPAPSDRDLETASFKGRGRKD
jgi:hypothetical protein